MAEERTVTYSKDGFGNDIAQLAWKSEEESHDGGYSFSSCFPLAGGRSKKGDAGGIGQTFLDIASDPVLAGGWVAMTLSVQVVTVGLFSVGAAECLSEGSWSGPSYLGGALASADGTSIAIPAGVVSWTPTHYYTPARPPVPMAYGTSYTAQIVIGYCLLNATIWLNQVVHVPHEPPPLPPPVILPEGSHRSVVKVGGGVAGRILT